MNVKIWYTSAAILGGLATFIYVYIDRLDHLRYVSEIRDGPPVQTFDPAVFQFVLGLSVLFVPIGGLRRAASGGHRLLAVENAEVVPKTQVSA